MKPQVYNLPCTDIILHHELPFYPTQINIWAAVEVFLRDIGYKFYNDDSSSVPIALPAFLAEPLLVV